ncbi:MAG: Cache 3/Cache 2 fusion domain-containing protein [Azoarcus sp.]|nr:Cache 3/Cache 2 fusion domain-containing protein [Azoarcus sp.]
MREPAHRWLQFKLIVIVISVTVVALSLFDLFAADRVGRLESQTASAALLDKSRVIRDMLVVNNDSMTIAADKLLAVFQSMLPGTFTLDESQRIAVGGQALAILRIDGQTIGSDFARVDEFSRGSGGHPATIFVRHGDDFARLATSLQDAEGERALGTLLGIRHPGYAKLIAGQPYAGYGRLFGRPYMMRYEPIIDHSGYVIGVLFVGLDLSETLLRLKQRIQAMRVGKTGYVYVLDAAPGPSLGEFVIHPTHEGGNILALAEPGERALFGEILASREDSVHHYRFRVMSEQDPRAKVAAFAPFAEWGWVIGGGAYVDEFTEERRNLKDTMLGAMVVAALAIIVALSTSIRRLVLKPLFTLHETLRASEERFRTLVGSTDDIIYTVDCDGCYTGVFGKGSDAQGWRSADFVGHRPSDVFDQDAAAHEAAHAQALRGTHLMFEWSGTQAAAQVDLQISLSPMYDDEGRICGLVGISRDITVRKKSEARLMLAASVFTHAEEGIVITDPAGNIVEVNAAYTRITGYEYDEVVGRNPRLLNSGRQAPAFYKAMWHTLTSTGHWRGELWNRRKDGMLYAEMLSVAAVCDADGRPCHYVGLFSDITRSKEHQRQLEHIAHYDMLTGLPNRVLLADRLQQAIVHTQRAGNLMALVYLDLDGFKAVNDQHGHEAGDDLLVVVSKRLRGALRETDTLARLGGDEFVAVLSDLYSSQECDMVVSRLLLAAATPVQVGETWVQMSASLGVTLYPLDGGDADTLLRHADQAMYQAKEAGRNRYQMFDPEHDRQARGQRECLKRMKAALEEGQLVLHYQPQVNMRSGEVLAVEALVRWHDPERGLLFPGDFLPAIEGSELIIRLGEWVLDTALSQMSRWRSEGLDIRVSVNIAGHHLQHAEFLPRLQHSLDAYSDLPAQCLELEVLETVALDDLAHVVHVIECCQKLGVNVALDDFGTGYSSLTYLRRLPANTLKIDQSFVRGMLANPEDRAIVEGVIGLAAAFRRNVVAEGVETAEHGALLLELGCDLAQGYGIARPMRAEELRAWINEWGMRANWLA